MPLELTRTSVRLESGKLADLYVPQSADAGVVLVWHGSGADERSVMEPLATAIASAGIRVIVPDWRSDAADGGRAQLLASLEYSHQASESRGVASRVVLAGWSLGAVAAAEVAVVNPWPETAPAAVVGIAGRYSDPGPLTGDSPISMAATAANAGAPIWLVHGTSDDLVSIEESRRFAALLTANQTPVVVVEIPTDHAGVVLTTFDPARDSCVPSSDPDVIRSGTQTVNAILSAVSGAE